MVLEHTISWGPGKRIDKAESESLVGLRRKLTGIEGKATEHYFKHIFQLIPNNLRPDRRRTFKAYDACMCICGGSLYLPAKGNGSVGPACMH